MEFISQEDLLELSLVEGASVSPVKMLVFVRTFRAADAVLGPGAAAGRTKRRGDFGGLAPSKPPTQEDAAFLVLTRAIALCARL